MNKFYIVTFGAVIILFGVIFFAIQGGNLMKNSTANKLPSLPADAGKFTPLQPPTPNAQQIQQAQVLRQQQLAREQQQALSGPQGPSSSSADLANNIPASATATIKTVKGDIVLTLYGKDAPHTVENFINKAKSGFYNGLVFHRVEDWVIQGGDPQGNGTGGGHMLTELNDKPFVTGSLGVARGGDISISNDSQFFITKSDASWLNHQYTNFGMVTEGMDVVDKIQIGDKIKSITINQ